MLTLEQIKAYLPVVLFGLICFASFMSSITCSMISLEGKAFNILKSVPINPFKVILSKIYTAVIIMLPCILIGDLIMFIKFNFSIFEILILLIASVVLPLVAETIGILVNLNHPKMDAENDAQVVKQSMSSMVAVLLGMLLTILTFSSLFLCIGYKININLILFIVVNAFIVIEILLLAYMNKKGVKRFNKIQA
jgi:ABC-2 type transport system permease protein